jgi:hypothetical protein
LISFRLVLDNVWSLLYSLYSLEPVPNRQFVGDFGRL